MERSGAPGGEAVECLLGHRVRGRHYQTQPVALVRPVRGSARFAVRCLTCGQTVTLGLARRGAGGLFRALFWRWNIALSVFTLSLLSIFMLSLGTVFLSALAAAFSAGPSATDLVPLLVAVSIYLLFALIVVALLVWIFSLLARMPRYPRIIDGADREASTAVLGNFALDHQHHLLTNDGTRRLLTEKLRGRFGWFTPMRVASATPSPVPPMPMPVAPAPYVPAGQPPVQTPPADAAAWGATLGQAHAIEAQRTGVMLSGEALATYARQIAEGTAPYAQTSDPTFVARYTAAYIAAYTAGLAPGH